MNKAPYWRLMWKEFRTVRGFWLALAALSIVGQALTLELCRNERAAATIVFNLALGTPVFFALGAAGMAFAIEKEEGTFDFLRAAPISARQIITSKLSVAVAGTLLMFLLLCPVAWGLLHPHPHENVDVSGVLGLWLPAVLEAIAWGTFFSLWSSRPLVAICLAVAAASTSAHLLAWSHSRDPVMGTASGFSIYLAAAPLRVGFALAILWLDIFLAKRWLRDDDRDRPSLELSVDHLIPYLVRDDDPILYNLTSEDRLMRRTGWTMIRHLLWQGWRQSAGATVLMMGLIVLGGLAGVSNAGRGLPSLSGAPVLFFTTPFLAALVGSFVFMADKERRRLRFLVEHNIPARLVWLARQLHWIAAIFIALGVVYLAPQDSTVVRRFSDIKRDLEQADMAMNPPWAIPLPDNWHPSIVRPLALFFLLLLAVPYTAGQWASMMIRSSILAGLFGLILAAVLCGWVAIIGFLNFPLLWPVAAVPLLLLWATWFRAPDWIREDISWRARRRAAAAVLGPALALLVAVPLIRVYQIPWVDPGYDRQAYPPTASPEGHATADLYRRAIREYIPLSEKKYDYDTRFAIVENSGPLSPTETAWLQRNEAALALALEASKRPDCNFRAPRGANEPFQKGLGDELTALIIASARHLEAAGQLDAALERFFVALRVNAHFFDPAVGNSWVRHRDKLFLLYQIAQWGARNGQTSERVAAALARLRQPDPGIRRFEDELKNYDSAADRYFTGDDSALDEIGFPTSAVNTESFLIRKLLPWEEYRGRRMLNGITAAGFGRLREIQYRLATGTGVVELLPINDSVFRWAPLGFCNTPLDLPLNAVAFHGADVAWNLVELETWRRASVLLLAIDAHKLRHHGKLPRTLAELVGPELPALPKDPCSGSEFRYYPAGLPGDAEYDHTINLNGAHTHQIIRHPWPTETPCIWCTGPELGTLEPPEDMRAEAEELSYGNNVPILFYDRAKNGKQRLSKSRAWGKGYWFPIPEPAK